MTNDDLQKDLQRVNLMAMQGAWDEMAKAAFPWFKADRDSLHTLSAVDRRRLSVIIEMFAQACHQLDDLEVAAIAYRRAIELGMTRPNTYFLLGNSLALAGKFEEATEAFQSALTAAPGYSGDDITQFLDDLPSLFAQLANACDETGRRGDAVAFQAYGLLFDSNDAAAVNNLMYYLQRAGDRDAVVAARQIVEMVQRGNAAPSTKQFLRTCYEKYGSPATKTILMHEPLRPQAV